MSGVWFMSLAWQYLQWPRVTGLRLDFSLTHSIQSAQRNDNALRIVRLCLQTKTVIILLLGLPHAWSVLYFGLIIYYSTFVLLSTGQLCFFVRFVHINVHAGT